MRKDAIISFLVICLLFGATAKAESPDLPTMPAPEDSGIKFLLVDEEEGATKADKSDSVTNPLKLWAIAGPSFLSYTLKTSSPNSIKLPMTRGTEVGLGIAYKVSPSDQIRVSLRKNETDFAAIPGVTTALLTVRDLDGRIGYAAGLGGGFFAKPSYRLHDREVREVSPVAAMTGSIAHGLHLEAGWAHLKEKGWSILMRAGLFTPIFFKEKFQETGSARIRLYSDAGMQVMYALGGGFKVGFYPSISLEYRSYSGATNRAVRDGKERWIGIVAPVQVTASF